MRNDGEVRQKTERKEMWRFATLSGKEWGKGTLTYAGQLASGEELLLTSPCVLRAVGGTERMLSFW